MLALTLYQPWGFAVVHRGKDIENRSWSPPKKMQAEKPFFAIHAGRHYDEPGANWLRARGVTWSPSDILHGYLLGVAKLSDVIKHSNSKWFMGEYGWCLSHITPLPKPIKCNGSQGLWYVGEAITEQINAQLAESAPGLLDQPLQGLLFGGGK